MNLTDMVRDLIKWDSRLTNAHGEPSYYDPLFDRKAEILTEMAKRIEALEQREHSHPFCAGSYCAGEHRTGRK